MKAIKTYSQLIRVKQWYKNLVVFLAIFFSGNLLNLVAFKQTVLAFLALSFVSSAGYIINDLKDKSEDQYHPERRLRPLAAGTVSPAFAVILVLLLLVGGYLISSKISSNFSVGDNFLFILGSFFLLSLIYTFFLKKIIFADILSIATLFVLRAVAGAIAISVYISPWLILVPFFLALFLAVGKRHSDLLLLQEKAGMTKKVLQEYTIELTKNLMNISTTLLIFSYALYSFLSEHQYLIATLPLALYVIFRFYYFISSDSPFARNPEKSLKDKAFIMGLMIWLLAVALIIYFPLVIK